VAALDLSKVLYDAPILHATATVLLTLHPTNAVAILTIDLTISFEKLSTNTYNNVEA